MLSVDQPPSVWCRCHSEKPYEICSHRDILVRTSSRLGGDSCKFSTLLEKTLHVGLEQKPRQVLDCSRTRFLSPCADNIRNLARPSRVHLAALQPHEYSAAIWTAEQLAHGAVWRLQSHVDPCWWGL